MTVRGPEHTSPVPGALSATANNMDPVKKPLFWRLCRTVAYVTCTLLFDYKSYGVRHIPKRGGALLISNHQSYLDPVLLGVNLPRPLSYLAKSELFQNTYLRWLIVSLRAIPIHQGKGDKGALEQTIRRLQEGHLLNLFPEGTRTEDGKIGPIQRGVALIVRRARVPIIPAVISGSFQAWPQKRTVFHAHPIRVLYGAPLQIEGLKGDQVVELIGRTLREMFDDLEAGRTAKYR